LFGWLYLLPINQYLRYAPQPGCRLSALQDGKIDLGFVGSREAVQAVGLQFRAVASYQTVAALPKNLLLAHKPGLKLKDLAPMFFIGLSETSYPGYRRWLDAACRKAGFIPRVLQDVEIEATVFQSVGAGLGIALVSEQLKKVSHPNVVFRSIKPKVMTESCIAWRDRNDSAAVRAYLDIVTTFSARTRPPQISCTRTRGRQRLRSRVRKNHHRFSPPSREQFTAGDGSE
jgi:DNA-binding transcriptional LysR family regulator